MKNLTAAQINQAFGAGSKAKLRLNRHQKVDKRLKTKQEHLEERLRASVKADFSAAMKQLGV